jgi:hypothetical protein
MRLSNGRESKMNARPTPHANAAADWVDETYAKTYAKTRSAWGLKSPIAAKPTPYF